MSDPSITSGSGSQAAAQLISLTSARSKIGNLFLTADQNVSVPSNLKSSVLIIPSTSQPAFGSYFVCDIKQTNILLQNITLQFNISAVSSLSGATSVQPNFNPAWYFFTRIELLINGQVFDTIYGNQQFIKNQLLFSDPDIAYLNAAAGSYMSATQRTTLATAASNYYVNLHTLFDENSIALLTTAHNVQLRVYMDSLANCLNVGTCTGTAAATINYCNVIARITQLPQNLAQSQLSLMSSVPFSNIYHDLRYATFNVNSGVSNTTIVLTPIVGRVSSLMFVVRPTASLTGANAFSYTAISNFALLDSASTNIVGGQTIASALALQVLGTYNSRSQYLCETAIGVNSVGTVTNNGANVYIWSFSSDSVAALTNGQCLNSYYFTGAEQLQITFTGTLGAAVQVDLYAFTEQVFQQGATSVVKQSL